MSLARISKIIHKPSGVTLETPLLIPSFSSKGFSFNSKGNSEIGRILNFSSEFITDTFLISAYDIHHGHIGPAEDLPMRPELIFLDSGGYEASWDHDYSATVKTKPEENKIWDNASHQEILNNWPDEIPAVYVSYDHPKEKKTLEDQIDQARRLFRKHPQHLHLFLVKPETDTQPTLTTVLKKMIAQPEELAPFDIIGLTEKELGDTMLNRMANIAKLRIALDKAGMNANIHIFGALDPLSVCLYFVSGAEIFDGLTWIRYAYESGRCVYPHNHGVLKYGLHTSDKIVKQRAMTENIYCLEALRQKMREFLLTEDFEKFHPHGDLVRQGVDSLNTKI